MKGTFVAGLKDERIRYIVKAKGEDESLAQLVETALQEESEVRSQRYRSPQNNNSWPQGYIKRENKTERPIQIKREVNIATGTQCFKCQGQGHIARNCDKQVMCFKCGKRGHVTRNCQQQGNRR
jgi:Arginine methyltransferase-interacting protein, contains RING Zn-finger